MKRLCELTVTIGGYDKTREKLIKYACMVEWSFRQDDFIFIKPGSEYRHLLQASSLGTLYENEDASWIIERLERAIWRANNGMCHVEVVTREINREPSLEPIVFVEDDPELQVA